MQCLALTLHLHFHSYHAVSVDFGSFVGKNDAVAAAKVTRHRLDYLNCI